jgi:hypothetical protein
MRYEAAFKMRYNPTFQKKSRSSATLNFFSENDPAFKKNRIPQLFVINLPSFGAEGVGVIINFYIHPSSFSLFYVAMIQSVRFFRRRILLYDNATYT